MYRRIGVPVSLDGNGVVLGMHAWLWQEAAKPKCFAYLAQALFRASCPSKLSECGIMSP
jgi:hypothetical protein